MSVPQRRSSRPTPARSQARPAVLGPSQLLDMYGNFITKNAGQVAQIESTLRSLTYIIPGRFRDAEIASEAVHSSVQLLSLYHDSLLQRSQSCNPSATKGPSAPRPGQHTRYTQFWATRSKLYRRIALVLQIAQYTELLIEMAARRRGEHMRWRVVVVIEAVKAFCRLLLLRITKGRTLLGPPLPEREPLPEQQQDGEEGVEDEETRELEMLEERERAQAKAKLNGASLAAPNGHPLLTARGGAAMAEASNGHASTHKPIPSTKQQPLHSSDWTMPRTGLSLPALPSRSDISGYLLGRVLTADDVKPAPKLLRPLTGAANNAAEVLHILAPLVYAALLARSKLRRGPDGPDGRRGVDWTPWVAGLTVELAARQLRERGLRVPVLERDEWTRRGWAMGWWIMRGAFYEDVTKGWVDGLRARMPDFVGRFVEDYQYLWEAHYFATSW